MQCAYTQLCAMHTCLLLFKSVYNCLHLLIPQTMLNKNSAIVNTWKFVSSGNATRCTVVGFYRGFRGTCRLIWHVNMSLSNYTSSHPRREGSSYYPPWWPYMSSIGTCFDLLRSSFDFLCAKSLVVNGSYSSSAQIPPAVHKSRTPCCLGAWYL
jgi:hypothetical protein